MVQIEGKYQQKRNEILDAFARQARVPYIILHLPSPLLEVTCEGENWTIRSVDMMRTHEVKFRVGEEYDEVMPSGDVLKCTTTRDGDSLTTITIAPNGEKATRTYVFSDEGVILTMVHERSGEVTERYFKRL